MLMTFKRLCDFLANVLVIVEHQDVAIKNDGSREVLRQKARLGMADCNSFRTNQALCFILGNPAALALQTAQTANRDPITTASSLPLQQNCTQQNREPTS